MSKTEGLKRKYKGEWLAVEVTKKVQELAEKGLIRLATGSKVEVGIPPRFPGKPLSEYLKEIRE